jgi:uncharacterized NAD(P)/FAD-binding protein YdhS
VDRLTGRSGPARVAIVGGGASGALVAMQLLRRARGPLEVAIVEPSATLGRGRAYPDGPAEHVLNVPASQMSVHPDDPAHFARWLAARADAPDAADDAYAPRALWGAYVEAALVEAARSAPAGVAVRHVRDVAVDARVEGGRVRLNLLREKQILADAAILALGHPASRPPLTLPPGAALRWHDSLGPASAEGLDPAAPVVVAGSGLTLVDLALSLSASGHRGTITAVSRHGLLPRARTVPVPPSAVKSVSAQPRTARALVREIRRLARAHDPTSGGAVVNALRDASGALWDALPPEEKRRVLRHAMPFWNVFRHRMAPGPSASLDALLASGRLRIVAGRLLDVGGAEGDARVTVRLRGSGRRLSLRAGRLFAATGPGDVLALPLVQRLIAQGLAAPDALGLGLDADSDGRLGPARGGARPPLYGLGPVFRGRLWETTAIPEVRVQAARLAAVLCP